MARFLIVLVLFCSLAISGVAQTVSGTPAGNTQWEKMLRAYRNGPIAENVQIRVKDEEGRERRSEVLIKLDASHAAEGVRALIELGDLALSVQGQRMVATHRLERDRFAEFTLPAGPLLAALETVMPSLVLPQLVLADQGSNRSEDLGLPATKTAVRWSAGAVDRATGKVAFDGEGGDWTFRLLTDRSTGRIASLMAQNARGPIRSIDLTVRSMAPGDPATWAIDTTGRQRVDALIDLVADAERIRVGEMFPPNMSLLSTGLSRWQEVRADLASVLVFVPVDTAGFRESDPVARDEAIRRAQRETGIATRLVRMLEAGSKDRWVARCVAVVPADAAKFDVTEVILTLLNSTDSAVLSEPVNQPLIAIAQSFDYDALFGGGQGGVVVIDKARIVRAIITLGDLATTEAKVRAALDALK